MPWFVIVLLAVYGLSCVVFAFKEPPSAVQSFFKVPAIFVFLPDRWILPVGRIFVGACAIVSAGFIARVAGGF